MLSASETLRQLQESMGIVAEPKLQVILKDPTVVVPAVPTRNHVMYLSNMDQPVLFTVNVYFLYHAYPAENHDNVAKAMREALAKVLVPYYPVAGRLQISLEGELELNCNGKGVLFVEAEADAAISDLEKYTESGKPDPRLMQLVYFVPEAMNQDALHQQLVTPAVVLQATRFRCGGFALGVGLNHAFMDGISVMQFLNAWAAIVRGDSTPLSAPSLDRTMLRPRSPRQIDFPHHEFGEMDLAEDLLGDAFVNNTFHFTRETLTDLIQQILGEPGGYVSKCSTFETLAAHVWRARTKALEMEPSQETKFLVAVDVRSKFIPPVPSDYVGNSAYPACAMTTAGELLSKPLSYAVSLIQQGVAALTDKYLRSALDNMEDVKRRPASVNYSSFAITDWSRLGFYDLDFGWGKPFYCGPVTRGLPPDIAYFLLPGGSEGEKKNLEVAIALPPRAMEKFIEAVRIGIAARL